jgi:hypothetical protein
MKNIRDILCAEGRDSLVFNSDDLSDFGEIFGLAGEKTMATDQLSTIARLTRQFCQAEFAGDQLESKKYFNLIRAFITEHS